MTLTTTFVNRTTVAFKLIEKDDVVLTQLCLLEGTNTEDLKKSRKTVEFDPKSTYKEYRVVESRASTTSSTPRSGGAVAPVRISITSDFVMDHGTIYIDPSTDTTHNFAINGDPRPHGLRVPESGFVAKFMKLFKRN